MALIASGLGSPSALASMSYRSELNHLGAPASCKSPILYARVISISNGKLTAVNLPPFAPILTARSDDLFSLIDATSNSNLEWSVGADCAGLRRVATDTTKISSGGHTNPRPMYAELRRLIIDDPLKLEMEPNSEIIPHKTSRGSSICAVPACGNSCVRGNGDGFRRRRKPVEIAGVFRNSAVHWNAQRMSSKGRAQRACAPSRRSPFTLISSTAFCKV
jgi:hypothetical protein